MDNKVLQELIMKWKMDSADPDDESAVEDSFSGGEQKGRREAARDTKRACAADLDILIRILG